MEDVLDDNGVWEYKQIYIPKLAVPYAQALAHWKKDIEKSRGIIIEGVRDHVVFNFHGKETPFSMWKTLTYVFQISNVAMKLELRDKIRSI